VFIAVARPVRAWIETVPMIRPWQSFMSPAPCGRGLKRHHFATRLLVAGSPAPCGRGLKRQSLVRFE